MKKIENECCDTSLSFNGNSSFIIEFEPTYQNAIENTPFWYEFTFDTPIDVTFGQPYFFDINSRLFELGVNFAYSNGEFDIFSPNDFATGVDLMFLMTYTLDPNTPATFSWIDLN